MSFVLVNNGSRALNMSSISKVPPLSNIDRNEYEVWKMMYRYRHLSLIFMLPDMAFVIEGYILNTIIQVIYCGHKK